MTSTRLQIAATILQGICSGDWKFDTKEKAWDDIAVTRSLELADKLIEKHQGENDD
jgi:hypothetical protein